MTQNLDLADIQGNILQDFVSGYPVARFVLLHVSDPAKGRAFVLEYRSKVTTALRWASSGAYAQKIQTTKPDVAINIGFTFTGLLALGLPTRMLARLPPEFIDGMKARAAILGDDANDDALLNWDPVWGGARAYPDRPQCPDRRPGSCAARAAARNRSPAGAVRKIRSHDSARPCGQ